MSNRTCFLYYKDWAELLLKMPEDLRHRIDDAVKKYVFSLSLSLLIILPAVSFVLTKINQDSFSLYSFMVLTISSYVLKRTAETYV